MDLVVVDQGLEPPSEALAAISVAALVPLAREEDTIFCGDIFEAYSAFKGLFCLYERLFLFFIILLEKFCD